MAKYRLLVQTVNNRNTYIMQKHGWFGWKDLYYNKFCTHPSVTSSSFFEDLYTSKYSKYPSYEGTVIYYDLKVIYFNELKEIDDFV